MYRVILSGTTACRVDLSGHYRAPRLFAVSLPRYRVPRDFRGGITAYGVIVRVPRYFVSGLPRNALFCRGTTMYRVIVSGATAWFCRGTRVPRLLRYLYRATASTRKCYLGGPRNWSVTNAKQNDGDDAAFSPRQAMTPRSICRSLSTQLLSYTHSAIPRITRLSCEL